MIGVANRPGGYTGTEQDKIEILSQAAGVLYDSYRRQEREAALEKERRESESALHESWARFAGILDIAQEAIVSTNHLQQIIVFNKGAEKIFGYSEKEVIGQPLDILLPEKFWAIHRTHVTEFGKSATISRRMGERLEITGRRKNGEEFPAEASISKLELDGEKLFTVVLHDITERKRAEAELRKSEEQFRQMVENIREVFWMTDLQKNQMIYISPGYEEIWGRTCESLYAPPRAWLDAIHPGDRDRVFKTALTKQISGTYNEEYRIIRPDGSLRWIRDRAFPVRDDSGKVSRICGIAEDITEIKRTQAALAEQAIRDTLTGLYNRRYFDQRLSEEIARAARNHYTLAIMLCDLEHFKIINDTRGHQAGDEVLQRVAKSLQNSIRGIDLVFRWGGDEFVVVLSDVWRDGVLIVADRIREGIQKISDAIQHELDLSIGVSLYPEHSDHLDELMRLAEMALYIAKRKGNDKVHIGTEDYDLSEDSIKVVFQPVVDVQPIRNIRTQEIIGYEALSRDPKGKLSILDLFEKYRAIGKLHELKCICFKTQLKTAKVVGLKRVFINVDFNVLSHLELISKPPGMEVILEISELEAIREIEARLEIAQKWRNLGYKFAIDDFGAGFISLPFIARLRPEFIKVDRFTILQAVSSEQFKEFMIGLIFGLRNYATEGIIAEGVETEHELKVVKDLGIYVVQGFLLGKPQELK